jgi:prevent-host-death family protein
MTTVGVKELKNRLSEYLRRVGRGERVVITDRGRPVAVLGPTSESTAAIAAWRLVQQGLASWNGGKPELRDDLPTPRKGSVSDAVLEDRG